MAKLNLSTTIIPLTIGLLTNLTAHSVNKRFLRFVPALWESFKALGNCPMINFVADSSSRRLDETIDRIIIIGNKIVRGCGRIGTVLKAYIGDIDRKEKESDDSFAKRQAEYKAVAQALVDGSYTLPNGTKSALIEIIQLADDTPESVLRRIASDDDSTKVSWNKAQRYQQWLDFVKLDGLSPAAASILVGHRSRRQTYEQLEKVTPSICQAWIDNANGIDNPLGKVTDSHIDELAKLARAYDATPQGLISTNAEDKGQDYADVVAKITIGGKSITRVTGTVKELADLQKTIRQLPVMAIDAIRCADLLLCLSGIDPDCGIAYADSRGQFVKYTNRLIGKIVGEVKVATDKAAIDKAAIEKAATDKAAMAQAATEKAATEKAAIDKPSHKSKGKAIIA